MNRRRSLVSVTSHLDYEQLRPFLDTYDFFGEWYEFQSMRSKHDDATPPDAKRQKTVQEIMSTDILQSEVFSDRIRCRLERCIKMAVESAKQPPVQAAIVTWNTEKPTKFLQLPGTWGRAPGTGQVVGDLHVDLAFIRADGVIETLEGKRIGVNRALVSSFSEFFRRAFYGYSLEADAGHVILSRHTYRSVLAFLAAMMQQSKGLESSSESWFKKDPDLALDMLDLAIFLQAPRMVDSFARCLVSNAVPLTYVLIAHRIGAHHRECYELLWKKILADFFELVNNNTYRLLTAEEFERALEEPSNISKVEELEALKGWARYNEKTGGGSQERRKFRQYQHNSPSDTKQRPSEASLSTGVPFFFPTRHRLPYSLIAVLGGWATAGPTSKAEVFDAYEERWIEPVNNILGLPAPRSYHEVVPMLNEDKMYVIGGFDGENYYEGSCAYDLKHMVWEENSHAFMNERRCYVSACQLDASHVIAVGGYNNRVRLQSTEILNTTVNLWSPAARMNYIRSDCHTTLHEEKVYVIGGFDGNSCHQTAEFYDSVGDRWHNVGRKMRDKRSGVCSVSIRGAIIAVGGFTGRSRLTSCEFFDPREGQWHAVASMNSARSNFGIAKVRDHIYVAGGYDGNGTTTRCEKFDIRCNKWFELPELIVRRSALSMCTLDGSCVRPEMIQQRHLP